LDGCHNGTVVEYKSLTGMIKWYNGFLISKVYNSDQMSVLPGLEVYFFFVGVECNFGEEESLFLNFIYLGVGRVAQ
jgi:hypothetical protein